MTAAARNGKEPAMRQPPTLPSATPPPGYLRRNWRWLLPLVALVLLGAFAGLVGWGLTSWGKAAHASVPMREALRRAGCSVEVVAALGEPLRSDRLPHGNMSGGSDGSRTVALAVGVHGPEGSGRLYVHGRRHGDVWDYPVMYVLLDDEQTLDLSALDDAAAARRCELQACRERADCPLPLQGVRV